MNYKFYKKFIAVVPDESHVFEGHPEINNYIHSFIISKPCPELIRKIEVLAQEEDILGILTRGSTAQYLYEHDIAVPVLQLEYSLSNILDILNDCKEKGWKNIGIVEMGYAALPDENEDLYSELCLGEFNCVFYKLFGADKLETVIRQLKENGIDVLICDVEPASVADKYGVPNFVFPIDINCYKNTLIKGIYSTNASAMEETKNRFIEDITNLISEGIIIFNKQGNIIKYNHVAEEEFLQGKKAARIEDVLNLTVEELGKMPANSVVQLGGRQYVINLLPSIVEDSEVSVLVLNQASYIENMEMSIRKSNKQKNLAARTTFDDVFYVDEKMKRIVEEAKRYSKSSGTVMILGETGTGKEMFASGIHNESFRADGPFLAINCAVFTESLIESELFGYEKGSFTGALTSGKKGIFEMAHGGTVFLDEIGEMPLFMQAKLLRVLQEKEVWRIGGESPIPIDVRIIVATNKKLCKMVEKGDFREDLYYRLSVLEFEIPPLRERRKDIIPLFCKFAREAAKEEKKQIYWNDESIFDELLDYNWMGNVRELKNFAERVVLLAEDYKLEKSFIHKMMEHKQRVGPKFQKEKLSEDVFRMAPTRDLKELEREYTRYLLERFSGDKDKVCEYLNISRVTLWRRLEERE